MHCFKYNKLIGYLRLFDLKKPWCFALKLSSNQIISIASEFIWCLFSCCSERVRSDFSESGGLPLLIIR